MRKRVRKLALVAGAVSAIGFASPAAASPTCVGTQEIVGLCVQVEESTIYEDCFYLASSTCTPVVVPGVDPDCSGWVFNSMRFFCEI